MTGVQTCALPIYPAAEYGKEGFEMWEQLMGAIQEDTVRYCYGVTINTGTQRKAIVTGGTASKSEYRDDDTLQSERGRQSGQAAGIPKQGAKVPPRQTKPETVRRDRPKVGRNDPCPCGSGKKYKNCCMKKDMGLVDNPFEAQ